MQICWIGPAPRPLLGLDETIHTEGLVLSYISVDVTLLNSPFSSLVFQKIGFVSYSHNID